MEHYLEALAKAKVELRTAIAVARELELHADAEALEARAQPLFATMKEIGLDSLDGDLRRLLL